MIYFSYQNQVVELRNPDLGEEETLSVPVARKRAMTGKLYAYKSTNEKSQFVLSFSYLDRSKIIELFNFMKMSAGQEINYLDSDGVHRRGRLLGSLRDSTEIGRHNNSIVLIFEGDNA